MTEQRRHSRSDASSSGAATEPGGEGLSLRLLGPMELLEGGRPVALPRSKKTRALLAYLAGTGRAHRRDRLCSLLWDVTDDPRGALRWSLSRLRKVLGSDAERICADAHQVSLAPRGMRIDALQLEALHRDGLDGIATGALVEAASLYRGEFLEGLELPDFLNFSAWCIERREQSRRQHCALLSALIRRFEASPEQALPYARQRAQADLFSLDAQLDLLRLLLELNHVEEAQVRFDHALRQFRQMSAPDAIGLEQAWRSLRQRIGERPAPGAQAIEERGGASSGTATTDGGAPAAFVGRQTLLARLEALLQETRSTLRPQLALLTGEPGIGKSRLADRMADAAKLGGFAVVSGRAFEAESARPFGPWSDLLAMDVQQAVAANAPTDREGLFEALKSRLTALAGQGDGLLLVLDDLQWFDRNSAELLHYVIRSFDAGPLMVLALARGGELPDNEAVTRLLRSLRKEHPVSQFELEALSEAELARLLGPCPPDELRRIQEFSAGNPFYALECARAWREGRQGTPATLLQLVQERVARLPDNASDALRWGAILGHTFDPALLEDLIGQSAEEMVDALERLEQAALLRIDTTRLRGRYVFAHDLVREAVYSALSHPRRRLMHRKVALLLEPRFSDPAIAADVAHHASLAGEAALGVRACTEAGHHALRVFANTDAEALALRGLRLAEELDEPSRIEAKLDLLHVLYSARTPEREQAAVVARELAERALDLGLTKTARKGFQMVSYLRWEGSSLADAHANILQAERVSRLGEAGERAVTLAQAARCLVLLERNLQQAEAFVLEAASVSRREGQSSAAVAFASGMIAAHRGEAELAAEHYAEARQLARQQGEHLAEFGALEHHLMLELDRGSEARAAELAAELVELGGRVRPGAEAACARALSALASLLAGRDGDEEALTGAVDRVREADAKYELAYLLNRWARHALDRGQVEHARSLAGEALQVAQAIGRASDIAVALATLAEAARRAGDRAECSRMLALLEDTSGKDLSAHCRAQVAALRQAGSSPGKGGRGTDRRRG